MANIEIVVTRVRLPCRIAAGLDALEFTSVESMEAHSFSGFKCHALGSEGCLVFNIGGNRDIASDLGPACARRPNPVARAESSKEAKGTSISCVDLDSDDGNRARLGFDVNEESSDARPVLYYLATHE